MKQLFNTADDAMDAIKQELQNSELESVMRGTNWASLMQLMSDATRTDALGAESESYISFKLDYYLMSISERLLIPSGYDGYEVDRERNVQLADFEDDDTNFHTSKRGRIDSKYSSVIIEYKKPAKYKTTADNEKAMKQAERYLEALNEEDHGEYLAIVTDGLHCQFIEWFDNSAHSEPVADFNAIALDRLIKSVIKLSIKSLNAENLINDLVIVQHNGSNLIYALTNSIYKSANQMCDEAMISYRSWLDNFGLSHEDVSQQQAIEDRRRDLAKIINKREIESDEEYKILFSLHTATAVVAMLIAYKVVSVIEGDKDKYALKKLYDFNSRILRIELNRIANGAMASQVHIYNLLELNCFSWIFLEKQWSNDIFTAVNDTISALLRYENMPDLTDKTDDIFRNLYMSIMPTSVRHSLGEYYTPAWLAENVINEGKRFLPLDKVNNIRVLDSAAGSGTFPQRVITIKRKKYSGLSNREQLNHILNEVASIDANVLAVILARINYFLSISDLISPDQNIYIPVFIGDSTISNSDKMSEDSQYYLSSMIDAAGQEVLLKLPVHSVNDKEKFINTISFMADLYDDKDECIVSQLEKICTIDETEKIKDSWIKLKKQGMLNKAMVSSITDYYLLCALGKYDLIVGNPPWVDWKSLPSVHREKIKNACISRKLFSGDGRTGGINLNVCALLTNITAENWLDEHGVLCVLMPQNLLFQQSYEGYRNLYIGKDGKQLYFQEVMDWSKSGHPFYPVQQLFCTYILSDTTQNYFTGIPYKAVSIKRGMKLDTIGKIITKSSFSDYFDVDEGVIGRTTETRTAFTVARSSSELKRIQRISGETDYIGREGVEYYPQELQLFKLTSQNHQAGTVELETYKNTRSKYSIGIRRPTIETKYLRPLIKGINISRFHVEPSEYIVAFPYDCDHYKIPFSKEELNESSPLLYNYYRDNSEYLKMQTGYSDSIIGNRDAEYYALARTGAYSHAPWYVIFRDNTKWVSAVVGKINTEWGGEKIPAFQNHCVSICEHADGSFISVEEAYYICGILNTHLVEDFVLATSDKRTFKIRIPVKIVPFSSENNIHMKIAALSRTAHLKYNNLHEIESIRLQLDELYLSSLQ